MGCAFSDEEGVQPFLCYFILIDSCFAGDLRKQVLQLLPKNSKL